MPLAQPTCHTLSCQFKMLSMRTLPSGKKNQFVFLRRAGQETKASMATIHLGKSNPPPTRASWIQHFEMQVSKASCLPSPFTGPKWFGVGEPSSRANRVNMGVDLCSSHRKVGAMPLLCITNAGTKRGSSAGLDAHRNAWGISEQRLILV